MSESPVQLDLLGAGTRVPQANNLSRLIVLVEELARGPRTIEELAELLGVEVRTARWYVQLADWLDLARRVDRGEWTADRDGGSFAENRSARGRILSKALFDKEVVKLANAIKRQALDEGKALSTREACRRAIERTTDLADSTIERRASSLASLLRAAYRPSEVDWETGQRAARRRGAQLQFAGESFLTALGVKQLGVEHRVQVGWPRQVHQLVCADAKQLEPAHWKRASYKVDVDARWFGSVPLNDATRDIAVRGGPNLRELLVVTAPYVALWCAFGSLRDPLDRALTQTTRDLFGYRLWFEHTELGPPIAVLDRLAERLGFEVRHRAPHLHDSGDEAARPAEDEHLVDVLVEAGICRRRDTVFELAPGVTDEWRVGGEEDPSVEDRLAPLRDEIRQILQEVGTGE
ncbi:MAG: hypothetical protein ACOCV2_15225 [Persicimonas sp.]